MPERKTLNEDLFYRGSSANLPRLHTCEIKSCFGILVDLPSHYDPSEKIYKQTNSISMGSPLGSSISEFYISHFENKIFNAIKKPKIYVHYVDNIFVATWSYNKINKLKQTLEKNSILKFTTELNIDKKSPS